MRMGMAPLPATTPLDPRIRIMDRFPSSFAAQLVARRVYHRRVRRAPSHIATRPTPAVSTRFGSRSSAITLGPLEPARPATTFGDFATLRARPTTSRYGFPALLT